MNISSTQLRRAADIQDELATLKLELDSIFGEVISESPKPKRRYKMGLKARRAIAVAQKARWAKVRAGK